MKNREILYTVLYDDMFVERLAEGMKIARKVRKEKFCMKKADNFNQAPKNLDKIYKYDKSYENVVLTGLVIYYSLCFEQSWKVMKEILEDQGSPEGKTGSPKQVIKNAFRAELIKDEEQR